MGSPRALDVKSICREKLSIFYGSVDNYEHGLKECIANGKDVINKYFDSGILTITVDNELKRISVKDTGTGINIEDFDEDGEPLYKLYFETLFAGGNFDNAEEKIESIGTNGCGTTVLNHISKYFRVESARNGKVYEVLYENGGKFVHFKKIGKSDEHYSIFEFELDEEVYKTVVYDKERLKNICLHSIPVDNKITLILELPNEEPITYHYEDIKEYFDQYTNNKTSNDFYLNSIKYEDKYDIYDEDHIKHHMEENNTLSCIFSTSSEVFQETYLNGNYLSENGTIYDGFINGFKIFINKYCKDKKLIKGKNGSISKDDIQDSISFVMCVNSTKCEFNNQTKFSTTKKLYGTRCQQYIQEQLEILSVENLCEFEKIIKHILEIHDFNTKTEENKKKFKNKLSIINGVSHLDGLVDCKEHGEDSELYANEGKSAHGSTVKATDRRFQASMPLRGKVLNPYKATTEEILNNDVIDKIMRALGCGVENKKFQNKWGVYDPNKLRYGKFMIATDQDSDGADIRVLLISEIYYLCPSLLLDGRVYIVKTPLYEVKLKDDSIIYYFSETEKNEKLPKLTNVENVSRAKGIGELDAKVMAYTGVNPKTRNIDRIVINDREAFEEQLEIWMGKDVTRRKIIIESELDRFSGDE